MDLPVLVYRKVRDLEAVAFEALASVDHGLVLGGLRDDVVALLLVHGGDALDRQVVALGGAAGEDDLLGRRSDQGGDLVAGFLDGGFGLPAEGVAAAGRVPELLREVRQ